MAHRSSWLAVFPLILAQSALAQADNTLDVYAALNAAKFAESAGDLAKAEAQLRTALTQVAPSNRDLVTKALAELLRRQGREAEAAALVSSAVAQPAATSTTPSDPIANLLAQLETGTEGAAHTANRELGLVLELAMPQLLDAIGKAGPFGRIHLLGHMLRSNDPRVAERLNGLLRAGDPGLALTIAKQIGAQEPLSESWQPSPTIAGIARELATSKLPADAAVTVLQVLVRIAPNDDVTQQLAKRLVADTSISQYAIPAVAAARGSPWAATMLEQLANHADLAIAARGVQTWLHTLPADAEARAVAAIERLPAEHRYFAARAGGRAEWARVGIIALRSARHTKSPGDYSWLNDVQWTRAGDDAVQALCEVANQQNLSFVREALGKIIRDGWRGGARFDAGLAAVDQLATDENSQQLLLEVLGPGDEARARGALPKDPHQRRAFVQSVASRDLPWHDLIATHLSEGSSMVYRSWRGAPQSALDKLHDIVAHDPEGYAISLLKAAQRWGGIPVRTLALLFTSGNGIGALQLAIGQDPRATLEALATAPRLADHISTYLDLLRQHGTVADLPFALRLARELDFGMGCDGGANALSQFFVRFGRGNLGVLALGELPATGVSNTETEARGAAAQAAAAGLQVEQVADALQLLPRLCDDAASATCAQLATLVEPRHQSPVSALFAQVLAAWRTMPADGASSSLVNNTLPLLCRTNSRAALEQGLETFARVAATAARPSWEFTHATELQTHAAEALLSVAAETRPDLLRRWLESNDATLAYVALRAPETVGSAVLRELGVTAMRRLSTGLGDVSEFLTRLDAETRVAACQALVNDVAFVPASPELANAVLRALGDRKDASLIPTLAHGARHRNGSVRACCAAQLGRTFSLDAAPALLELLKDDEVNVRKSAEQALSRVQEYLTQRRQWEASIRGEVLQREGREATETGKR